MVEADRQRQLAGWGARAGAVIIDNLLLAAPWAVAIGLAFAAAAEEDTNGGTSALWVPVGLLFLFSLLAPFVYFPILNGNERGQTLGKRVTGIRVRGTDGGPLGVGRALGRYLFVAAIGFFFPPAVIVDYLWPLWDKENQALHDKVVDSIVVKA